MRHAGFKVPVNHGVGSEIECGVGKHQEPDLAGKGKDCTEHQSNDCCLFKLTAGCGIRRLDPSLVC